jgi:hypothetical protein
MARIPIYVRQPNAIAQQQLHALHEELPEDMWPTDTAGAIYITYQEGRRTEEAARVMIEDAIAGNHLSELSLSPWSTDG